MQIKIIMKHNVLLSCWGGCKAREVQQWEFNFASAILESNVASHVKLTLQISLNPAVSLLRHVLVSWGFHSKTPQTGQPPKQKFIFSHFRKLEGQDQVAIRVLPRLLLAVCRWPPSCYLFTWPSLSAHALLVSL